MTPHQMLAVYLLFEEFKGVKSFWSPYIAVLPHSFTAPAFFTQKELQLLPKCSYNSAKIQIEKVAASFEELSTFFKALKKAYPSMSNVITYS